MIEPTQFIEKYDKICRNFRWQVAKHHNMANVVSERHINHGQRTALIDGATGRETSFAELDRLANRFANMFRYLGTAKGSRVAVLLEQRTETAAFHIAAWKLGAISLPLFTRFGPQALAYRLGHSGCQILLTDRDGARKIEPQRANLPALQHVICVDGDAGNAGDADTMLEKSSDNCECVPTLAEDPAVLIYTSGTTGDPKGALHAHRVLLGHLPGVQISHDLMPQSGDCFWTPADWAWIGGLFDVLMPGLYFGLPVVMQPSGKFDPEQAHDLMARRHVRNCFLPPTALRLMRDATPNGGRAISTLRSVASGGERLGDDVLDWGRQALGLTINEFYGQTECNMVISSCASQFPPKPGAMGKAVPGHEVEIVDEHGKIAARGEIGDIAVRQPDPVMFLNYLDDPGATAKKFRNDWLITGDRGYCDEQGYFTFVGRDDDIISSSGYRIGPAEIEACLCQHEAVAQAAVIGVPDKIRGELIQAHIVLRQGIAGDDELSSRISDFVRQQLSAHEYPRDIIFRKQLPMTATGKVRRNILRDEWSQH